MTAKETRIMNLMEPGHTGCAGCGQAIAARLVVKAAGPRVMIANATGCLEVYTTTYPRSSWEVPWIHSLFENPAAVASGMEVPLKAMGRHEDVKIIAQAGDGGTADIGIGCLSGMLKTVRVSYILHFHPFGCKDSVVLPIVGITEGR